LLHRWRDGRQVADGADGGQRFPASSLLRPPLDQPAVSLATVRVGRRLPSPHTDPQLPV